MMLNHCVLEEVLFYPSFFLFTAQIAAVQISWVCNLLLSPWCNSRISKTSIDVFSVSTIKILTKEFNMPINMHKHLANRSGLGS